MELLRLALVGGLVGLDTTAAFQVMVSQPLVGGLLAGWALGDPWTGAFVGLLFQGLYLAEFPMGARLFPDGNMAAVQAAALTVLARDDLSLGLGLSLLLAFFWSILAGVLGGYAIVWTRRLHGRYLPLFDRLVAADRRAFLDALCAALLLENFAISAIFTMILFVLGSMVLSLLAGLLPSAGLFEDWGLALRGGLLGAGCAAIFVILLGKMQGRKRWLAAGAALLAAGIWVAGY